MTVANSDAKATWRFVMVDAGAAVRLEYAIVVARVTARRAFILRAAVVRAALSRCTGGCVLTVALRLFDGLCVIMT